MNKARVNDTTLQCFKPLASPHNWQKEIINTLSDFFPFCLQVPVTCLLLQQYLWGHPMICCNSLLWQKTTDQKAESFSVRLKWLMVQFIEYHNKAEFPPVLSSFVQGKRKQSPFQQLQVSQSVQLPQNYSLNQFTWRKQCGKNFWERHVFNWEFKWDKSYFIDKYRGKKDIKAKSQRRNQTKRRKVYLLQQGAISHASSSSPTQGTTVSD